MATRAQPGASGAPESAGDDLSRALRRLFDLAEEARRVLAERVDLPPSDVRLLEHLMAASLSGGSLGPSALAERLGVTPAAATQALDRLERVGHVRRQPHPTDGRRQVVHVTEAAMGAVWEHLGPFVQSLVEVGRGLTDAERAVVLRWLQGAAAAHEQFIADAPAPD